MLLGSAGTTAAWPPVSHTHQLTSGEEQLEQTNDCLLSRFLVFSDFLPPPLFVSLSRFLSFISYCSCRWLSPAPLLCLVFLDKLN